MFHRPRRDLAAAAGRQEAWRGMTAALPSGGAAGGGRRREALLRQGAAAREAERLRAEDLARLERERSPGARSEIAAKFGRLFDELCQGGSQREIADVVLRLLARDLVKEVRQALAEAVATSGALPHDVACALAAADIDVARPILESSPVLTDADLLRAVRANSLQYALAVAGRERVSEPVADALVGTGAEQVVARLVGNNGARLSRGALRRVMEDFAGNAEVQSRLVRRPELPHELVERLVAAVGERIEWQLVQGGRVGAADARAIMAAVRERAAINFTARGHADAKLERRLKDELLAGALDHEALLRLLRDGEVASLEIGIGLLAGLEPATVRRLLYEADRRHLAALCLAAGFPTPHYLVLRVALDLAEEAATVPPDRAGGCKAETLRFLQQQYEALRDDPARRDALLGATAA